LYERMDVRRRWAAGTRNNGSCRKSASQPRGTFGRRRMAQIRCVSPASMQVEVDFDPQRRRDWNTVPNSRSEAPLGQRLRHGVIEPDVFGAGS